MPIRKHGASCFPSTVFAGDLDSDDKVDLVFDYDPRGRWRPLNSCDEATDDDVAIDFGTSQRTRLDLLDEHLGGVPRPVMAVGDLDQDGSDEIVTVQNGPDVLVRAHHGDDTPRFLPRPIGRLPRPARAIHLADIDNDGRLDVIALVDDGGSPAIAILLNLDQENFRSIEFAVAANPIAITSARSCTVSGVIVLLEDGRLAQIHVAGGRTIALHLGRVVPSSRIRQCGSSSLDLGDFDGDGLCDIAAGYRDEEDSRSGCKVAVLLSRQGRFAAPILVPSRYDARALASISGEGGDVTRLAVGGGNALEMFEYLPAE